MATLDSYGFGGLELIPKRHWAFLDRCQDFHETQTHLFLHAGYVPTLPLSEQPAEALRWTFLGDCPPRPHCSGKKVVLGHTPQTSGEVLDLGYLMCIDTDCSQGGWLTALDVKNRQVWQADERGRLRQQSA